MSSSVHPYKLHLLILKWSLLAPKNKMVTAFIPNLNSLTLLHRPAGDTALALSSIYKLPVFTTQLIFPWWVAADHALVYFSPSSAHFSFMQQCWLACRSVRQLSPLIRCLAGSDRAGGTGVLAGSCPWHKARTGNRCWEGERQDTDGLVWKMGYRLDPWEMVSGKEKKGWLRGK